MCSKVLIVVLLAAMISWGFTGCCHENKETTENPGASHQKLKNVPEDGADEANDTGAVFNFDTDALEKMPVGWSIAQDAAGACGIWSVVSNADAVSKPNVLFQSGHDRKGSLFNVAIAGEQDYRDVEVELMFKAIAGDEDQGGGPVWRYHDASNYYVCRANPLEDNFRVYKVVNGHRKEMQSADVRVPADQWHSIKASMQGNRIRCWLNGKLLLDLEDDTFDAGKIGVWTKADAQTYFDNIVVKSAENKD